LYDNIINYEYDFSNLVQFYQFSRRDDKLVIDMKILVEQIFQLFILVV